MNDLGQLSGHELRRQAKRGIARVTERLVRPPSDLAQTDGPSYVGVGAQRCGTSRWHELLCAHPDAGPPRGRFRSEAKELHWFTDESIRLDRDRYRSRFPSERGVVGEWTPRYLHDRHPIVQLASWFPSLRYLVVLRDPLDRLDSAVRFAHGRGQRVDDALIDDAIERGCYRAQLEHLFGHVDRERVLVLQFERCNEDPGAELARTYDFVGLDSTFVPGTLHRVVNAAANSPSGSALAPAVVDRALERFHAERAALAGLVPELDLTGWA